MLLSSLLPSFYSIIHHAYAGRGDSFCACVQAVKSAGDECRLHAGIYELGTTQCNISNVRGTFEQPIVIAAAGDGPVVLDGTLPVAGPWRHDTESGHYSASAPGPALQLFVDSQPQVLARYPNARWSDRSIFFANSHWFKAVKPGVHDTKSGKGVLLDAGQCAKPADCCAFCNEHDQLRIRGVTCIVLKLVHKSP